MYNIKISLPTKNQIKGPNQLDVFDKYGICCSMTDACRITSDMDDLDVTVLYLKEGKDALAGKACYYWLNDMGENNRAYTYDGGICYDSRKFPAIRPILDCPELFDDLLTNATINDVGIPEVTFGEYVLSAAPRFVQRKLNHRLEKGTLKRVGESYTWQYGRYADVYKKHFVYEYEGKKYVNAQIRYIWEIPQPKILLSNRCYYPSAEHVWLEVVPWTWLMDVKTKLLVSKKGMIAGVSPFDDEYGKEALVTFLKTHLLPDLIQCYDKQRFDYTPSEIAERKSLLQRIRDKYSNPNKYIDANLAGSHEERMDDIWTNIEKITDEAKKNYFIDRYNGLKAYYNCYYVTINHKNPDKRNNLNFLDRVVDLESELRDYLKGEGIKVFHMYI